jgi:hypothetical protein
VKVSNANAGNGDSEAEVTEKELEPIQAHSVLVYIRSVVDSNGSSSS